MKRDAIDLVIVRGTENSKYISGFFNNGGQLAYRPFAVLYFADPAHPPAFIVPAVDLHLAMDSTWIEDVRAYAMAEFFTDIDTHFFDDFFQALAAVLSERGVRNMTIGTEGSALPAGFNMELNALLAGNRLVDIAPMMEIVRMEKAAEEIRRLKTATKITMKAHAAFRAAIGLGVSDHDLFRAATSAMINNGCDGIKFINIGCGPETAYAAHSPFPVGHLIARGDFVRVDMGASYLGYGGDFVRWYFAGEASPRHKDVWRWLNDAQMELGMSLTPGMTGGEIFDRGYSMIDRHLPDFPREFVGHGLGLGTHEQPRMNRVNRTVLEPDTVFCIEYSYYQDGCRHHTEETFLISDSGVECWTKDCPRDLAVEL